MTRWLVPIVRRLVQAASCLLLVLLPLLALYSHYKEARAVADLPANQWQSRAVRAIDSVVGEDPQRVAAVAGTQGTFWSARILGVSLTDPLAGLEALASSRSWYAPLAWSLLIPLLVSLLLGRVFCGWICPMNTLLEIVDKGRGLLGWLEIRQRDVRFSLWNKYVILAIALGLVAITSVPFLALIYPPAVLSREMHTLAFGGSLGAGLYLILAICAFELLVSKRWWCRYMCPGGAVYSLLGRWRAVRVRRDVARCTQCGDCVRACQFDLRPMLVTTTGMECTNCAACISGCDYHALSYQFVLPVGWPPAGSSAPTASETQRPASGEVVTGLPAGGAQGAGSAIDGRQAGGNATDGNKACGEPSRSATAGHGALSRRALLLGLTVGLGWLAPTPAGAHHILGLPHYAYKENYPQTPTLEYPATTGPYDVLMTSYPGKPVPGEAATIAFYIKDRTTGQPYHLPVTVQVLKSATFGTRQVVVPAATHAPFDNQHKYTITVPDARQYIIELALEVEGQTERIPFLIVAGEPPASMPLIAAIAVGLTAFLLMVRAVRVKRQRRQRRLDTNSTPDQPASRG